MKRRRFLQAGAAVGSAASLRAQEVAMGARRGSGKRFEAPYSFDVKTEAVAWAKPLTGGPIKTLAVATVNEGRTVVELAQRVDLDLTTVTIDPAWDLNKWTMSFGRDYGARAERGDLKLIYSYLEEELVSNKKFDVIVLPLSHGWEAVTPKAQEALERRVREGCGLVLIRPLSHTLSPLEPVSPPRAGTLYDVVEPALAQQSAWRSKGRHYVTRAVPVDKFPYEYVRHYAYRAKPGAEVLIESAEGEPVLAVQEAGKGRVIGLGYANAGWSWRLPMEARYAAFTDASFEHFYALLCRVLLYAGQRETRVEPDWKGRPFSVRDAWSRVVFTGRGGEAPESNLPPGTYFRECIAGGDFRIDVMEIPGASRVDNLKVNKDIIAAGDELEVSWTGGKARVELVDGFGRVIARGDGVSPLRLKAGQPLSHNGHVAVTAGPAHARKGVLFAASSREWEDYEVLMPWFGPKSYQPWISAVDEQFRKIGITTLASPERNFKVMASAHLNAFGIYWYRRDNYLNRKKLFAETGDKKYLTREIVLQSAEFERSVKAQLEKVRPQSLLRPFAYYLADESSLTCYADPFDVDFAPEAVTGFRDWLRKEYGTIEKLNESWGTKHEAWDAVVPMTTAEAQQHGNYAPWADHRAYMEFEFARAFEQAARWLKEMDPGARSSISGTQVPTAHNGCNWYEIDQRLDYLQPYSGGEQDSMHHLFRKDLLLTGFTGYGKVDDDVKAEVWRRLFYGHTGASIFWHYTLMNPDLTLSEQGSALAEAFGKMQGGIGKIFQESTVVEDGVAVHFSMASIRAAWIVDGVITGEMQRPARASKTTGELERARSAWVRALEKQGLQFRFLATPQIESGALKDYKVLILPYSMALSDKEAVAINEFLKRGGVVYADEHAGKFDERCRKRAQAPALAGARRTAPGPVEVTPSFEKPAEGLWTVRSYGGGRLIGLLPAAPVRVSPPKSDGIWYDLLRGREVDGPVEATPGSPAVLVERKKRTGKIAIDDSGEIRLAQEGGGAVDSVVRVEVIDARGRVASHYCRNVMVRNGRGKFVIPWSLSDAGEWTIRVKDVVSGVMAERKRRV